MSELEEARAENDRLTQENWQLKQACGYSIPADKETPQNPFRCGTCDARTIENERLREALTRLETESKFFRPAIEHIAKLDGTYVHVAINAVATAATALHALAKEAGE